MKWKFKTGDCFCWKGEKGLVIGKINDILPDNRYSAEIVFFYDELYSRYKWYFGGNSGFGDGSGMYNDSRIISEKEALAWMI
ncbi:MAG: hypothetical protein IMZ52_01615 [Actinobacteria bacterium]|nr:hypothetical protein [Actinomycetota bacterium]MBE3114820.1 hypothetical protein [Actinomycetota bacterium]